MEPTEYDPEYLEPLRFRRMQEGEMNTTIQDILVYLLYLIVVIMVANGNRNSLSFYMKDTLATNVVHGGLLCGRPDAEPCDPDRDLETWKNPWTGTNYPNPFVDFTKVREVNQFWVWLHHTLIPNVRVQNWYNDDPPYGLRGYLDDRVNRIIGYAVIRQVREKHGNCRAPRQMRDYVESCTGDLPIPLLQEDDRTYCLGWKPIIADDCVRMKEFEFISETERKSSPVDALYRKYTGGGYELRMKGSIGDLMEKIEVLQNNSWIDNRTRAVISEFNVYNAQVNQFGIVKVIAEFVGGGIMPSYRIDVITLTKIYDLMGIITTIAEFLFAVSTFYYLMNSLLLLKSLGAVTFFKDTWNVVDVLTISMSLMTIVLYAIKMYRVALFTQEIQRTRGNDYISIDDAHRINQIYDYCSSLTVFTSMLKLCKLLSFQKAFRQIAATIRLCFVGLSTFVVEFIIVFGSFCCFFFFMLSSYLSNFRDMPRTVENTLAMAIGKFNFASLKEASEFAAWIFFAFSIVVNMILINMMMAIINMAFEETKNAKEGFNNKFEIIDYIKRSVKELTGTQMAKRDLPVILISKDGEDVALLDDSDEEEVDNSVSTQFSEKANSLLAYIDKTYLLGEEEPRGRPAAKINIDRADPKGQAITSQFDNIFGEGPTPTPSILGHNMEDEQVDLDDHSLGDMSMLNQSNVDGMNI